MQGEATDIIWGVLDARVKTNFRETVIPLPYLGLLAYLYTSRLIFNEICLFEFFYRADEQASNKSARCQIAINKLKSRVNCYLASGLASRRIASLAEVFSLGRTHQLH
jgi:hypothetical protein